MIRFHSVFYAADGGMGGGDGGDTGPGDGDGGGETWHSQHTYFQENPDAIKSFSKFKTADDAFKGAHELMQRLGKPYHLPKDAAKLTDEQRAEIDGWYRQAKGIPEGPEGYEFDSDDEVPDHEPTLEKFKALAHERGVDPQTAKDLLALQRSMVKELNAHRDKVFEGMGNNAYKLFKDTDCQGDAERAGIEMENISKFLQTFAKDKDGNPSPEEWEAFKNRHFVKLKDGSERPTELILLRALSDAARMTVGTGGASPSHAQQARAKGMLSYAEMDKR